MKRADIITGSLLVLFGLVTIFVIVPVQIDSGGDYGLDPSFFPLTLLWLVTAMAVLLAATRVPLPPDPSDAAPTMDLMNWLFIVVATVALTIAYVAIDSIGFIITSIVLIATVMLAMGARSRNWLAIATIPVIAPIIIYYALGKIFVVQLP